MLLRLILLFALLTGVSACSNSQPNLGFERQIEWMEHGTWLKVDTHIHSKFSDGAHTISEIAAKAVENGCDAIAITDHGDRNLTACGPEFAEAIEVARRQFPKLLIMPGLEWNVPPFNGEEHAVVLVPPGPDEIHQLAEFKSRFDDLNRSPRNPDLATNALQWLAKTVPQGEVQPLVFFNHPGRKAQSARDLATHLRTWRKVNDLVVGFEGGPGHQKGKEIGAYTGKVQIEGRWDPSITDVGGAWDELLAQGINVWGACATSDFHAPQNDYWPGEFSETWVYAPERSVPGILKGLRAGSFFAVHGQIAREVELRVHANGLPRPAYPGESIRVAAGTLLTVEVDCRIPQTDFAGQPNQLDSIELIQVSALDGRTIHQQSPATSGAALSTKITMPREEIVLRARGRRRMPDGKDLLFYTNPIRLHSNSGSGATLFAFPQLQAVSLRKLMGGFLLLMVAVSGITTFFRQVKTSPQFTASSPAIDPNLYVGNPPRRLHYLGAAIFFTIVAIYGSLVPLDFAPMTFEEAFRQFRELPFLELDILHRADWVANILLFVPISLFWMGAALVDRSTPRRRILWSSVIIACCVVLSCAIEFTQFWVPIRTTSQNDIVAEILGGITGVILWLTLGQTITGQVRAYTGSRAKNSQLDYVLQIYVAILALYSVMPLDLTIAPAEIVHKYAEGRILLVPTWNYFFGLSAIWNRITDLLIFVPVGACATQFGRPANSPPRSLGKTILLGTAFVAAIEFAQIFVYSRFSETADVIVGTVGVALGAYLMKEWNSGRLRAMLPQGRKLRIVHCLAALSAYALLLCYLFWTPFNWDHDPIRLRAAFDGFWRPPMAAAYYGTEFNSLTQTMRKIALFIPLGMLMYIATRLGRRSGGARQILLAAGIGLCFAFGIVIEVGQAWLPAHISDVGDILLYGVGTVIGASAARRIHQSNSTENVPRRRVTRKARPYLKWFPTSDTGRLLFVAGVLIAATTGILSLVLRTPDPRVDRRDLAGVQNNEATTFSAVPLTFPKAPDDPYLLPKLTEIPIPEFDGAAAIWASFGQDGRGSIWTGVSAMGVEIPSAHLFQYIPEASQLIDRGSVVAELRRLGIYRFGEGQMKIHSRILESEDGSLYFTSMDEQGEALDGSQLPIWGSHLWRLKPAKNVNDRRTWEHLGAVPEGLIALAAGGRWLYALGLFDHILYQYDPVSGHLEKVRVGSVAGHVSRNILADHRGHVYVPRVTHQLEIADGKSSAVGGKLVLSASLVEYDSELTEVNETPLEHYGADPTPHSHGIIALVTLADKSLVFATHKGHLYRIIPRDRATSLVEPIGWMHPNGEAYTPSLFCYEGNRFLVGIGQVASGPFDWLVFDLKSRTSRALSLLPELQKLKLEKALLYGSIVHDKGGSLYLGGASHDGKKFRPRLLKVTPSR